MSEETGQELTVQRRDLVLFGLLSFLELVVVIVFSLMRARGYTGVFLFGSASRPILEITFFLLLAIIFLAAALASYYRWSRTSRFLADHRRTCSRLILGVSILALVLGWAAVTIPPDFYGRFANYFNWLRPFGLVLGLIALQGWGLYLLRSGRLRLLKQPARVVFSKVFLISALLLAVIFSFAYRTGFGLVSDTPLWNVPGVPISGMQMFIIGVVFGALFVLQACYARLRAVLSSKTVQILLPILVLVAAALVWGFTPLRGDSLAVEPSPSNPQPYPLRDARVHDLGALSILYGNGINFKGYTDKPLYMVILALFHLVTGYDYLFLQWVQILFLSLIPVAAYLLGKRVHSTLFGVLVAVLLILQQRNAVVLSRMISSVNVKILATETYVLLGLLGICLLLFHWEGRNERRVALLLGALVGAISLIRLNPLLFVPVLLLVIIMRNVKNRRKMVSQSLLFILGFAILFLPWALTGTNADGQPFFFVKIRDIFQQRITPAVEQSYTPESKPSLAASFSTSLFHASDGTPLRFGRAGILDADLITSRIEAIQGEDGVLQYASLFASHFVHNLTASVIPLPDVLSHQGIKALAVRDYWDDTKTWDGRFSAGLIRFTIINLLLVCLGIAASWKRSGWKGLIPLMVFVVYDIAISVSLTSGGRYIVPIIWIVFFYYALGLVFLLESILQLFVPEQVDSSEHRPAGVKILAGKGILPLVIALVLVGSLIPAANLLVPLLVPQDPAQRAEAVFSALGPAREPEKTYFTGTVLYPVYEPGWLSFDLFRGYKVSSVGMDLFPEEGARMKVNTRLENGDPVLLVFGNDDQLLQLFAFKDDQVVEFWSMGKSQP